MALKYNKMARDARRQLADLRAMEEEDARMTMRGGQKKFIGAGATPSMGLSQFRGGRKPSKKMMMEAESETEEEEMDDGMEGGRITGLLTNIARARAPSSALVPFRPPSGALIPLGSAGRPIARPSLPASYYQNLLRGTPARAAPRAAPRAAIAAPPAAASASLLSRLRSGLTAANIARAASLGIPVAMLASYLADQGNASGDAGFYDDFAGEEFQPSGPTDPEMPVGLPSGVPSSIPSDLSADEIAFYLRSGNLPERYTSRGRRGRGVLQITHGGAKKADGRSARAEVVKKVMRERGVNLAQASKIVKEENLY